MIPIIILILSLVLDGLLTNYLPYLINDLSWFTPLLTVVSLFIIYPFFRKQERKYYRICFITGFLYDLFYTNLLFFNAILFLLLAVLSSYVYKNYEVTYLRLIIYTILIIIVYESITAGILIIFHIVPITLERVIYKITHSLLLNIIYIELLFLILNLIPKKYKKISIN